MKLEPVPHLHYTLIQDNTREHDTVPSLNLKKKTCYDLQNTTQKAPKAEIINQTKNFAFKPGFI